MDRCLLGGTRQMHVVHRFEHMDWMRQHLTRTLTGAGRVQHEVVRSWGDHGGAGGEWVYRVEEVRVRGVNLLRTSALVSAIDCRE